MESLENQLGIALESLGTTRTGVYYPLLGLPSDYTFQRMLCGGMGAFVYDIYLFFSACAHVYKSKLSDYFPVDLENDESGFSVSSRSYVRDNSPQQAFIAGNQDSGWQPTSQEVGEWLEMLVVTVREKSYFTQISGHTIEAYA